MVFERFKACGLHLDTQVMEFILWLCLSDTQRTVQAAGDYSQFMRVDPQTGALTLIQAERPEEPDSQEPPAQEPDGPEPTPEGTQPEQPTPAPEESAAPSAEEAPTPSIADTGERVLGLIPFGLAAVAVAVLTVTRKKNQIS